MQPVFIRSNTRFMEKGWPMWKRPDFPIRISFELGETLEPRAEESARDFTLRLQRTYEENLSRPHKLRRQIED